MTPLSRPQTFSALENLLAHRSNSCVANFAAFLSKLSFNSPLSDVVGTTLGRVVEHSGLSVQESRAAIENYEAAARKALLANSTKGTQVDDLIDPFMAVEADGSLARQVRAVVADNRSRRLNKAA